MDPSIGRIYRIILEKHIPTKDHSFKILNFNHFKSHKMLHLELKIVEQSGEDTVVIFHLESTLYFNKFNL